MMIEVKVREGNLKRALYLFNRKVGKSGILRESRERQAFVKPSEKRHKRRMTIKKFGV